MRTTIVSASEAARGMGDLLARVRYRNEEFLIRRGSVVVARLVPARPAGIDGAEVARIWRTLPHLGAREAAAFEKDVRAARRRAGSPPRSPWER